MLFFCQLTIVSFLLLLCGAKKKKKNQLTALSDESVGSSTAAKQKCAMNTKKSLHSATIDDKKKSKKSEHAVEVTAKTPEEENEKKVENKKKEEGKKEEKKDNNNKSNRKDLNEPRKKMETSVAKMTPTGRHDKEPDMCTYEKFGPPTDDYKKLSEREPTKSAKSEKSYHPPPIESRPKVPENCEEVDNDKNLRSLQLIKDESGFE